MSLGRSLIAVGILLVIVGAIFVLGERSSIRFGRLPGDIVYQGKNTSFYFPVVTCILISVVLSLVMWLINRFR
jgi:NADH:ubiquinone oxidoreductase subunit 6 (subunit J)